VPPWLLFGVVAPECFPLQDKSLSFLSGELLGLQLVVEGVDGLECLLVSDGVSPLGTLVVWHSLGGCRGKSVHFPNWHTEASAQ